MTSLLHFDARPYADSLKPSLRSAEILAKRTSGRKIKFIQVPIIRGIEKIAPHHSEGRLYSLPTSIVQYRIAAEFAKREGAFGLVTGYSLGQVAS